MLMIIIIILKCNAAIQKWQRAHIKYRNIYVYIYEYSHLKVHTQCFPFPLNFLLASAGSEIIANRSASAGESLIMLSNFTVATPPPAPRFTSPFREQDVAEGRNWRVEGRSIGWTSSIRWPFPDRQEQDAASGRQKRIRWTAVVSLSRGIPPRMSCTAPSIPTCIRRTSTAPGW